MYASQQDTVPPESARHPPLVAKQGDGVVDQKVRHAATRRAEQRDSRRASKGTFVDHPVWVEGAVQVRSCHHTPFQGKLSVTEIRAGLPGNPDFIGQRRGKPLKIHSVTRHRQYHARIVLVRRTRSRAEAAAEASRGAVQGASSSLARGLHQHQLSRHETDTGPPSSPAACRLEIAQTAVGRHAISSLAFNYTCGRCNRRTPATPRLLF